MKKQKFAFIINDKVFSGEGYVTSISMTYDSPQMFAWSEYSQYKTFMANMDGGSTIDITIKATETRIGQKPDQERLRDKKVDDCSIDELLFAVQTKLKLKP